jgi:hypothetical protein
MLRVLFRIARVVSRQRYAPAAFTPGEIPGTHFQRLSQPHSTWFRRREPRKKSPVTPPGIDPGTVRLVAQCLNHYATPGPVLLCKLTSYYVLFFPSNILIVRHILKLCNFELLVSLRGYLRRICRMQRSVDYCKLRITNEIEGNNAWLWRFLRTFFFQKLEKYENILTETAGL